MGQVTVVPVVGPGAANHAGDLDQAPANFTVLGLKCINNELARLTADFDIVAANECCVVRPVDMIQRRDTAILLTDPLCAQKRGCR